MVESGLRFLLDLESWDRRIVEVKVNEFTAAGRVSDDVAAEEEVRCCHRGEIGPPGTEAPAWE